MRETSAFKPRWGLWCRCSHAKNLHSMRSSTSAWNAAQWCTVRNCDCRDYQRAEATS